MWMVVLLLEMAKEVLQTQGVEFGSRARNLVFDMTIGKGQDMVFADYGNSPRMGQRNVVVVSLLEMAKEVLQQAQGIEFASRARNLVFDTTTGKGQDMVFADYGEHWRKMTRIATLPFFTNKVVPITMPWPAFAAQLSSFHAPPGNPKYAGVCVLCVLTPMSLSTSTTSGNLAKMAA